MGGQEFAPFGWWESMGGDFISYFLYAGLTAAVPLIVQKEGPRTTGPVLPQDLEHVRVHIFVPAVRFVSF